MAKITDQGFIDDGKPGIEIGGKLNAKAKFDLSPSKGMITQPGVMTSDTFDTGDGIAARAHLEVKSVSTDANVTADIYTSDVHTGGWRQIEDMGVGLFTLASEPGDQRALFLVDRYIQARYTVASAQPDFLISNYDWFTTGYGQSPVTDQGVSMLPVGGDVESHLGESGWGGVILANLATAYGSIAVAFHNGWNEGVELPYGRRLLFTVVDGPDVQQADCIVYGTAANGDPTTEPVQLFKGLGKVSVTQNVFADVQRVYFPPAVLGPGYDQYIVQIGFSTDAADPSPPGVSVELSLTGEVS